MLLAILVEIFLLSFVFMFNGAFIISSILNNLIMNAFVMVVVSSIPITLSVYFILINLGLL